MGFEETTQTVRGIRHHKGVESADRRNIGGGREGVGSWGDECSVKSGVMLGVWQKPLLR